jgi:hypothetical protein
MSMYVVWTAGLFVCKKRGVVQLPAPYIPM